MHEQKVTKLGPQKLHFPKSDTYREFLDGNFV